MTEAAPLLVVRDLAVEFPVREGIRARTALAVGGVSMDLQAGETLGLIGESGSGKSTIGNAVLGLVPPARGRVVFKGEDITCATARRRRALAAHIQVVFQDPYSSLNPARTIGQTLTDPLRIRGGMTRVQMASRVGELLERVGMPPEAAHRYPNQFSGGQRQRIAVARALVLDPDLVICDEPTSSLDLSIQAQILNLLLDLQEQRHLAYLFISHDIGVIRAVSHRLAVLRHGRIVEEGTTERVAGAPAHPYTRALISATPVADPEEQARRRQARTAMTVPHPETLDEEAL